MENLTKMLQNHDTACAYANRTYTEEKENGPVRELNPGPLAP